MNSIPASPEAVTELMSRTLGEHKPRTPQGKRVGHGGSMESLAENRNTSCDGGHMNGIPASRLSVNSRLSRSETRRSTEPERPGSRGIMGKGTAADLRATAVA